jgi:hypothetical protein
LVLDQSIETTKQAASKSATASEQDQVQDTDSSTDSKAWHSAGSSQTSVGLAFWSKQLDVSTCLPPIRAQNSSSSSNRSATKAGTVDRGKQRRVEQQKQRKTSTN